MMLEVCAGSRLDVVLSWLLSASAAENLISILQAPDGLSAQSQSSPVRGPEGCSYNSHGSSIQESPSEREWHTRPQQPRLSAATLTRACLLLSSPTADYLNTLSMSSASLGSDSELTGLDSALWSSALELRRGDPRGTLLKVQPPQIDIC